MKKHLKNPKAKAEMIASVIGDHFLEIARLLRLTHEESPDQFADVADQIGLSVRGAHVLARIDGVLHELRISRKRLEGIGWAKVQLIAGKIDAQNCEQILALAEKLCIADLQTMLYGDGPNPGSHAVVLLLSSEHLAALEAVMLQHGAIKAGGKLIGKEAALIAALMQQ